MSFTVWHKLHGREEWTREELPDATAVQELLNKKEICEPDHFIIFHNTKGRCEVRPKRPPDLMFFV